MVYIIGPYKIISEVHNDPLILKYLIIIDPINRWFEIVRYNKIQEEKEYLVDQAWLYIYSMSSIITYYSISEFFVHVFINNIIKNECRITVKCATTAKPQKQLIIELIHQVIGNLAHLFD